MSPSVPAFPGFNTLLIGPKGTGKTTSLATLCEAGLELFYLDIDNSLETLIGSFTDRGMPIPPNLHWHRLKHKSQGFDTLMKNAEAVGRFDLSSLAKMKDHSRGTSNQFLALLEILNNFIDQKDGKAYGPVDDWGSDRVLALDSLTGLNEVTFDMVVGKQPLRDKPDYGLAQTQQMNLILKLTKGCLCHFVLTAHVERQTDEIIGGVKLMPVTIGQATKSTLPIPFSDVILTARQGTTWTWDTANAQADLTARNLPWAAGLKPSFTQVVETWEKRKRAAEEGAAK